MKSRPLSLSAISLAAILLASACGGGQQSPAATSPGGGGTSPSATADGGEESPDVSPGESPDGESPSATTGGGGDLTAEGDLFAFGVTYESADEIGKVRIDHFREQFPDVNLEVSESGFEREAFLGQMQSGDAPDVVRMGRQIFGTYIARDLLMPVDECLTRAGVDKSMFYDAAINQLTVDGQLYGVPEFFNTRNWFINNSVFEEAGLSAEEFDVSDWDAIQQANEAILQADGGQVSRIGVDPKIPEFFSMWARANGVELLAEDGMSTNFEDPAVAEALEFVVGLENAHGGRDPFLAGREGWDFFGETNPIITDEIGAVPYEQFILNAMAGTAPEEDFTVQPFMTREGDPITLADGSAIGITRDTDNPDAACAFAVTLASTDAWVAAAEERKRIRDESGEPNTGTFTANREANDAIFNEVLDLSQLPGPYQEAVNTILENHDNAFAYPAGPANEAIFEGDNAILTLAISRVRDGEDAAQVLQEADQEAEQAIQDAANE